MKVKLLSSAELLAIPWTAAYQASPSMGEFHKASNPAQRWVKKRCVILLFYKEQEESSCFQEKGGKEKRKTLIAHSIYSLHGTAANLHLC